MSGLPYLLHTIVGVGGGQLADWLRSRGILTTGQTRKVSLTAGNFPFPRVGEMSVDFNQNGRSAKFEREI